MLIKLPPGMTPEQYYQTPEGQAAMATQDRRAQQMPKPKSVGRPWREPGEARDFAIKPGRDYDEETGESLDMYGQGTGQYYFGPNAQKPPKPQGGRVPVSQRPQFVAATPPVVPLPAYAGAGARQPVTRPGQAQPKADPYEAATPAPMDTFQEIFEALEEMAPDLPSHQRRAVARSLAEEYRRERMDAMDSLRPPAPMAEPTEQMEFDQAYSDMEDVGRAEDRMKARMEAQLLQEQTEARRMEQARAKAQQGRAGGASLGARPQWQMDGQRADAFGNAPAGAATGPRSGMRSGNPAAVKQKMEQDTLDGHIARTNSWRDSEGGWGRPDQAQWYDSLVQSGVKTHEAESLIKNALYWEDAKVIPGKGRYEAGPGAGFEDRERSEMYWQLVLQGEEPYDARRQVDVHFASRPTSPGRAQPIPPPSQGDPLGGQ